jgi:hypothetical protein
MTAMICYKQYRISHCPLPFVSYTLRSGHVKLLRNSMGRICRTNRKYVRSLLFKFLAVPHECQTAACQTQFCTLLQTLPRPNSVLMLLTHLGKLRNYAIKKRTVVSFPIPNIHVHLMVLLLYQHLFCLHTMHIASCFRPNLETVTSRSEVLM